MGKPWYLSKTVWFNVLFLVATLAGVFGYGGFQPSEDVLQIGSVLVLILNLLLRLFATKEPVRH